MRGAGVVTTGAGAGAVTTGAAVAGGVVTVGATGAGAGMAAAGAAVPFEDPLEEAGADPAEEAPDDAEPEDTPAAGEAVDGGAPATGTAAGSTAVPATEVFCMLATPEAPATFSSTVAGVEAADCCPLSARAATIAVVAARLRPAVKARVAGAVGPFFFEGPFGDRPADEPSATAARAAAGIRSVIVVFIFVIVLILVVVVIVVLVLVVIVVNLRLGGRWRTRWQRS